MAEAKTPDLRTWIAVIGTMLGAFMAVVDIQITSSSLKEISGGVGATASEGSWISTAYLIGEIITIPLTPWLSRVFTTRAYLLANIVLFLAFSSLCAFSSSLFELIIFRFGQGLTGGVFIPMALTVMLSRFPKNLHLVGQAIFGLTATLGPAIGPALGGWLTDAYGWEWNFYINFVPGAVMFATVWFAIDPEPLDLSKLRGGDWWGVAFMTIGLSTLVTLLEEGQREDWLGSEFIVTCAILSAIFVPAFVIREVLIEKPLVNLRLFRNRNLAAGSVVGFALGLGLYGSVYIIPLYLGEVQGFSPLQIGEVLIWVGLPQLLIFPVLPLLQKKFDPRMLLAFGCLLFAFSCVMNSVMDFNYGREEFIVANIVRALGQPFTIVPVIGLATGMLAARDAADGSAIFNILRNLGGSVGIAILSTLATRREQFHDFRIGESITIYNPAVRDRLATLQAAFQARGNDPADALQMAIGSLKRVVQREANIMAFNDCFLFVAVSIAMGAVIVWICKRPDPGKAVEAA